MPDPRLSQSEIPGWIEPATVDAFKFLLANRVSDPDKLPPLEPPVIALEERALERFKYWHYGMIKSLLSLYMEPVWAAANSFFPDTPGRGQVWLLEAISGSFPYWGNRGLETTPKQADKWKRDLQKSLKAAADAFEHVPDTYADSPKSAARAVMDCILRANNLEKPNDGFLPGVRLAPGIQSVLNAILESLAAAEASPLLPAKRAGEAADRIEFGNNLMAWFDRQTGEPHKGLVARIVYSVYGSVGMPGDDPETAIEGIKAKLYGRWRKGITAESISIKPLLAVWMFVPVADMPNSYRLEYQRLAMNLFHGHNPTLKLLSTTQKLPDR